MLQNIRSALGADRVVTHVALRLQLQVKLLLLLVLQSPGLGRGWQDIRLNKKTKKVL